MMKKLVILAIAALLPLVAVTPALAGPLQGQNGAHGAQRFALAGTIAHIEGDTITVQVLSGNRLVKPFLQQELEVQVTEGTRFMRWTAMGGVPITIADVTVGDSTSVGGTVVDRAFVARRVTVDAPLVCYTP